MQTRRPACGFYFVCTIISTLALHKGTLKRSYNSIALIYDRLATLMYGDRLQQTQAWLIQAIPPSSRVLIIGGGTGWILEEIARKTSARHYITYIDSSEKMIALARKRNAGRNEVTFVTATIQDADVRAQYDVVLTPFFFDNFTNNTLQKIFDHIDTTLLPHALWLYCDFRKTNVWWQRLLLHVMYLFFRACCGIEAKQLPDAEGCFASHGYKIQKEQLFLRGFAVACMYQKG